MELSQVGLIGLAVMGENLALNIERNGFRVSVYNRSGDQVDRFMNGRAAGKNFSGHKDLASFVASIERPRKIVMMIKAGAPVDLVIEGLLPHLDKGDILIDGGNSNYIDTERRVSELQAKGILFVGCGISGGEEGALNGPSIMPGGALDARRHVMPVLQKIAAQAPDGTPCCDWVGGGGSGHFVKMIHNGIEYGDMQLISEAYFVMKHILAYDNEKMAEVFGQWNEGKLDSYLIEITADILRRRDRVTGGYLIDMILDAAGQKGTGKWSVINSLEYGIPLNLISTAVYERSISALKELRTEADTLYGLVPLPSPTFTGEPIAKIEAALYASKLVSYAQGFRLMAEASRERGWDLNLGNVARLWRGGCIIRSSFLNKIAEAYDRNPVLPHLLFDEYFKGEILANLEDWREVVSLGTRVGLPVPAFSSALNYFHSLTTSRGSANMIQAQRDYFGAHMYERTDKPRGEYFHEDWVGLGGEAGSTVYSV